MGAPRNLLPRPPRGPFPRPPRGNPLAPPRNPPLKLGLMAGLWLGPLGTGPEAEYCPRAVGVGCPGAYRENKKVSKCLCGKVIIQLLGKSIE